MSPQARVRAQARHALKGKYTKAVVAFVVALLPIFIIEGAATIVICGIYSLPSGLVVGDADVVASVGVYLLSTVISVLLMPLVNGYIRCYHLNAVYDEFDLSDLFYYFNKGRYALALKLDLSFILRLLLPAVICFVPVIAYIAICSAYGKDFNETLIYSDFLFILTVLSTLMVVMYSLKYFTVFTLFCEREELSPKALFDMSKTIMRGRTEAAAKLIFSYLPWMLLCLTVMPMFYAVPYITQGLCISAKWLTRSYEDEQKALEARGQYNAQPQYGAPLQYDHQTQYGAPAQYAAPAQYGVQTQNGASAQYAAQPVPSAQAQYAPEQYERPVS